MAAQIGPGAGIVKADLAMWGGDLGPNVSRETLGSAQSPMFVPSAQLRFHVKHFAPP
jgi:hypothetical protein